MKSERISPFWVNGYQPFSAAENGSQPAVFNIDKLTVFEVVVKDAKATDLERSCDELRTNLENQGEKYIDVFK